MKRIVFDIETDNLLADVTRMWVLCTLDLDTGEEFSFLEGDLSWMDYLGSADRLIGHNIINYDLNVLKKLFGWIPKDTQDVHDTLLFSQMLNFRRFGFRGHALRVWGEAFGDPKGDYEDWSQYSEEMLEYCIQDVRLTKKVYGYLMREFVREVGKHPLLRISIRNETAAARFMAEAELRGWRFDRVKAIELLWKMQEEIDAATLRIEPLLGMKSVITDRLNPKTLLEKLNDPNLLPKDENKILNAIVGLEPVDFNKEVVGATKLPKWTKDGYYHATLAAYFGVTVESGQNFDCIVEGPYCRVSFEHRKLSSGDDVKHWLRSVGWIPDDFNYKKDPVTHKMVIVSDKISESSLLLLGELGEMYNDFLTTNSRANILRGWITECDSDWRIHGGAMIFGTPTGRFTHKLVANVPSVGNPWGADVRSLFCADPGTIIIGCDSAGNQMRGFCHHLDNPEYTELVLTGDVHQANADTLTAAMKDLGFDIVVTRKQAKTFIYAFLFGAGGEKVALYIYGKRDAGIGNKIKAKFMERTPGLKELNGKLEKVFSSTKRDSGYGYIYALDGGKVYSDSFHKVLNYLLQRFESLTVKSAMFYLMKKLKEENIWWQPLTIYHDETQFLVKDDPEIIARAEALALEAFSKAAEELGVMITGGDVKHGGNWRDTH